MDLSSMRFRSQEVDTTQEIAIIADRNYWNCDGDHTSTLGSVTGASTIPLKTWSTQMWDVNTPNFMKRSKRGEIINSPMRKVSSIEELSPCGIYADSVQNKLGCDPERWRKAYTYSGNGTIDMRTFVSYLPISSSADLNNLRSLAITKAWDNIDSSAVMELVCLAEFEKTLNGLARLLKQVIKVIAYAATAHKNLKKKRFRSDFLSEVKDIYMQARYGLRPLYYDACGIIDAVQTDKSAQANRFTYRGYETYEDTDSDEFEICTTNAPLFQHYQTVHRSSNISTTVRAGVLTQLDQLTNNKLAGVDLIAESAWELVPFSFIVDWFFNVGSFISSWSPNVGARTLTSWVSMDETISQTVTFGGSRSVYSPSSSESWMMSKGFAGNMSKVVRTKTREPNPKRPIYPVLDINLDPLKLLDLGIIVKQLGKRIPFAHALRF